MNFNFHIFEDVSAGVVAEEIQILTRSFCNRFEHFELCWFFIIWYHLAFDFHFKAKSFGEPPVEFPFFDHVMIGGNNGFAVLAVGLLIPWIR